MGVIHAIRSYDIKSIDKDKGCAMSFTTDSKRQGLRYRCVSNRFHYWNYLTAGRPDARLDIILLLVTRMRETLGHVLRTVTNHGSRIPFLILFCHSPNGMTWE